MWIKRLQFWSPVIMAPSNTSCLETVFFLLSRRTTNCPLSPSSSTTRLVTHHFLSLFYATTQVGRILEPKMVGAIFELTTHGTGHISLAATLAWNQSSYLKIPHPVIHGDKVLTLFDLFLFSLVATSPESNWLICYAV